MIKKIAVIGGDLRIVKLAEMLTKENFEVNSYAMEKSKSISKNKKIRKCETLEETIENSDIVIGPIPITSNNVDINAPFSDKRVTLEELAKALNGKKLIAGNIKQELYQLTQNEEVEIIDILNREELVVLNSISTAEGAIQIIMEETPKTVHGSNILILGFGKLGKILAKMLDGLGANVFCETKENVDLAWIKAYGYKPIHPKEINSELPIYDIVINTVPAMILDESKLKLLKKDCLILDLASNPGGVDKAAAKSEGLKTIWALSLTGKDAPLTSADFIKDTIYNIFQEIQ